MVSGIVVAVYIMMFSMVGVVYLAQYVMKSLGYMKCLQKAGKPTWKAWVPFYNDYEMFKTVKLKGFLVVFEIISFVVLIIYMFMYVGIFAKLADDADSYTKSTANYVTTNSYRTNTYSTNRYNSTKYGDAIENVNVSSDVFDESEYMASLAGIMVIAVLAFLSGIAVFVVKIFFAINISKAYGLGGGYIAGMILLSTIFILIIGFGKSKYILNQESNA